LSEPERKGFGPAGPLRGSLRPPADKSISHRAALIAAMGEGRTEIEGFLDSADTRATLNAARAVGAVVDHSEGESGLSVRTAGVGLRGAGEAAIDVGNAGTLLRLLPGWLAGQPRGAWSLDGDESIRRRPVDRIVAPLRQMGAEVRCRAERLPPVEIEAAPLRGIDYRLPVASAQVKSCLLLAALLAEGATTIREPIPSRDHTERMLSTAGVDLRRDEDAIRVRPAEALETGPIAVPGDFSSAAFFLLAALIVPGSDLTVTGVGLNPTRTGALTILERMGAEVEAEIESEPGGEPVGRIRARASDLAGTEIGAAEVPLAIDELPLIALAGCFADGQTVIRDAGELRAKESDRIASVVAALTALGGDVEATADGIVVSGTGGLSGGRISAAGDHRIAMLGAIAGLAATEGALVDGVDAVAVSYPGFERDLGSLVSG
jgi:3-phosphoshikimate 1-carboxyvinyltransferase